ncbi:Protein of unknown function [Lysobacter sp. cf310]|nr:Protein of unknown function [Lysobacter sp. cf310]
MIDIGDVDAPIYRIFSLERLLDVLRTQTNALVHPSKWDDPFENFFLKSHAELPDGTHVSMESLSASWYGQCWTRNRDSDAMWRIYSAAQTGVRIGTTSRALFSSFYQESDTFASLKYLIGSVDYQSRADIERFLSETTFTDLAFGGQPHRFGRTLLVKRPEFSHENEIRLLFHDVEGNHGHDRLAIFPFPFDRIVSEVALDPRLSETDFAQRRKELVDAGCSVPIIQSDLYQFSPSTIRLG